MGIKIPRIIYADTDCDCHPPGQSPLYVYATISGMLKGDLWGPMSLLPPNLSLALIKQAGCLWLGRSGRWNVSYGTAPVFSSFHISDLISGEDAFDGISAHCQGGFSNLIIDPVTTIWYGGSAQVAFIPPSPGPSLGRIMDEVVTENHDGWKAEVFPLTETRFVARMASRNGKSNVYIKYNPYA